MTRPFPVVLQGDGATASQQEGGRFRRGSQSSAPSTFGSSLAGGPRVGLL
jgi:hypothetical protein